MMSNRQLSVWDWLSWLVFSLVVAILKFKFHELWKDEWQAWFVARDMSVTQVLSFLYYEGHPALWYLYLKIFTSLPFFVAEEVMLSVAHLLLVSTAAWWLFVRHRFPLLLKWALVLSYGFFFEYGIINRGYILVMLWSLIVAWYIRENKTNTRAIAIALFLLCQTEVYGTMMALSFGILLWAKEDFSFLKMHRPVIAGLLSGLLVFVVSIFPRSAGHIAKTQSKALSLGDTWMTALQGNLCNAYLPGTTRDTFVYGWTMPGLLLSLLVLVVIWWLFRSQRAHLMAVGSFILMMTLFSALFFLGGIRQWSMGPVFLLSVLLIQGIDWKHQRIAAVLAGLLAVVQCIHGMRAIREDVRLPFSNARETGLFIKEKVPEKVPVVAINKFETAPVGGYAKRAFFELPSGESFTYFRWVDKIYLPTEGELQLFARYKNVGGVIVISPTPLDPDRFSSARLWKQFTSINYKDENYFLYSLPAR